MKTISFWIVALIAIVIIWNAGGWFTKMASPQSDVPGKLCVSAQMAVRAQLKAPATAIFPDCVWKINEYEITGDGKEYFVQGYVDSQNGFGAMLRSRFVVKLDKNYAATKVAIQ